ncbi:Rv1733c family protein [Prauserella muralis]|uniref:Uncharacterized protein n=1 Tax=Prauserella muralis TaxID=588067 RepID=A0A2V4ANU0_9PSEU|nr:hypothetical protein [Prauserella muralis]PXY22272.1 hypothetical protein BAY60_20555 [Prauserella muralis]TWE27913.1 hypothetical protein FHX69_0562 [Prauserella muralis]
MGRDHRDPTALTRLWRRLGPGHNPLTRGSDRVEGLALVLALLLPVLTLPFAAALGSDTYARQAEAARVQASTRHEATAVLVEDAPPADPAANPGGSRQSVSAAAEWRLPDGSVRAGDVVVESGAPAGTEVGIWLDVHGRQVSAPLSPGAVAWNAVAVAVTVWLGVVLLCALGFALTRRLLDRHRYARWQHEWNRLETEYHG